MLVAAYLVLFAAVLLFSWVIEERYGRRRPFIRASRDEHARLALVYAARAHSYVPKSEEQQQVSRELSNPQAAGSLRPIAQSTAHAEFLASLYEQHMVSMQTPGPRHHAMSLVPHPDNPARPAHNASFSAKSNPAKLALVPRQMNSGRLATRS